MEKRVRPTLALIGRSCAQVDEALAKAASEAAKLPRARRVVVLAKAQSECPVKNALMPAEVTFAECPPGEGDPQGSILRQLDAGTYVFVRALRRAIFAEGSHHADAELVLSSLTLAAALEAEAAGEKRR